MEIKECTQCGEVIDDECYMTVDDEIYCDDCHTEHFQFKCPICEDYHNNQDEPSKTYFYLGSKEPNLSIGFYKVLNFPVYSSDYFNVFINEYNVKLVKRGILKHNGEKQEFTDFICEDCFKEYTETDILDVERRFEKWLKELNKVIKSKVKKKGNLVNRGWAEQWFELGMTAQQTFDEKIADSDVYKKLLKC